MHAIRLHAFGPAENLVYEEVPDPRPGPGEALIAVEAAGVHLIDTALRARAQGELEQRLVELEQLAAAAANADRRPVVVEREQEPSDGRIHPEVEEDRGDARGVVPEAGIDRASGAEPAGDARDVGGGR